MAGIGCQTRGHGKAMGMKTGGITPDRATSPDSMHYRNGGFAKNPVRQPKVQPPQGMHTMADGSMMPNSAMPKMPRMDKDMDGMKRGGRAGGR